MTKTSHQLTPGGIATLACLLEVGAPKPGNVHRGADFEDVTLNDFMSSAVVLGQTIDDSSIQSVGATILKAVGATQHVSGTNTNLGMILLLVPLARSMNDEGRVVENVVQQTLDGLGPDDSRSILESIRLARPGGLGTSEKFDVNDSEDAAFDILAAMRESAERDLIAAQYANGFQQVFEDAVPLLLDGQKRFGDLSHAIVYAHVALMSRFPDSLIARKCGVRMARQSQMRAQKAVDTAPANTDAPPEDIETFWNLVGDLDFWLRADGHQRNPGTTADLIAAGLFVAIANGDIEAPFH